MKKLISIIVTVTLTFLGLGLISNNVYAVSVCDQPVSDEVKRANGCPGYGEPATVRDVIIGIINGIVGILSIVAVIFVIVGGVNYMTSAGDAGKVEKAKKTILYAVIGLVICALAFAIVNFFIAKVLNS